MTRKPWIIYTMPLGYETWRPKLFPGSTEARAAGCTCMENQPWPGEFHFNMDCKVHEHTRAK